MTGLKIALAGASGDLGFRLAGALTGHGAHVRALVRPAMSAEERARLEARGLEVAEADPLDRDAVAKACEGAVCVVSALNGLREVMIDRQGVLLDAAVLAGVPRFMPSDFSLDFTQTRPGDNRNMDLRRAFMARVDAAPIRATSVLNGAFADLLTGQAPIILHGRHRVLYWGDADQPLDFTTKDDVADYAAHVALDDDAPRFSRIAGDTVSARDLATLMTRLSGRPYKLFRAGGIGRLSLLITIVRGLSPKSDEPFSAWQGMQYIRDMSSGVGRLSPLDNDRYGKSDWTRAEDVLAPTVSSDHPAQEHVP